MAVATLISQSINTILGYTIYGKLVFGAKGLRQREPVIRYGLLMIAMWLLNTTGIELGSILSLSKNAAAIFMIPCLAVLSYTWTKALGVSKVILSIIIPCFNESKTILSLIDAVKKSPVKNREIIIVDDGSQDGTRDILNQLNDPEVRIIFHSKNKGKGAALRTGFNEAKGDICIVQDADLEYDPQEFPLVIQPILDGKADVVFGSRFQSGRPHRVVYFWHRIGNGLLTLMSNLFTDLNLSDMETCYKAFRREVIQSVNIRENRFGFEPEVTAKISKMNIRIYEVGISYYGRTYDEGKKIGWKDGVRAVYCILKYNLWAKN